MSTGAQGPATHPRTPKMAVGTPPPPQLLLAITPPKITAEKCLPGCARVGGGVRRRPPPTSASAAAVPAGQVDAGPRSSPLGGVAPLGEERSRKARHPSREGWRGGRWATTGSEGGGGGLCNGAGGGEGRRSRSNCSLCAAAADAAAAAVLPPSFRQSCAGALPPLPTSCCRHRC